MIRAIWHRVFGVPIWILEPSCAYKTRRRGMFAKHPHYLGSWVRLNPDHTIDRRLSSWFTSWEDR